MSHRIVTLLCAAAVASATPAFSEAYLVQQGPTYGPPTSSVLIVGAPTLYNEDGVMPACPYMYPDPAWKLCQTDQGPRDSRYYQCGPYSYHPFGINGYRPYGTYRPYRAAPPRGHNIPSARVITIDA